MTDIITELKPENVTTIVENIDSYKEQLKQLHKKTNKAIRSLTEIK